MNNVLDTQNDDTQNAIYEDVDSASDALLARWEDAQQLSEDLGEEATEPTTDETEELEQELETEDTDSQDEDDETDLEDEDEDDSKDEELEVTEVDDDALLEILVDGETQQVSVAKLKRLAGQEASLTRKSQEAAAQRKEAEEQLQRTNVVLQKMLENAEAKWKPYEEVDMLLASKTMDTQDFAQLRKEAEEAHQEVKFLTEEADSFFGELKEQQQQALQQAAQEAIKVLEADIPEWNTNLYNEIRTYAVSQGLPEEQVNNYVDPNVIKILHKARLFDQAKQVTTTKKKRTAKKVLKSKKAPANEASKKAKRMTDAKARLRTGVTDIDDVADILLSRWEA